MGSRARFGTALTAVLVVLSAALGVEATAGAPGVHHGVTRLLVPNGHGGLHSSTSMHAAFPLPDGTWTQMHGGLSGTVAVGAYRRAVVVRGRTCAVDVFANSMVRATRPDLTDPFGTGGVRVTASGTNGELHWVTAVIGGPDGGGSVAYAYAPTPRGVAPDAKRWTLYWADVRRDTGALLPICRRLVARTSLRETIRNMHLVPGALHYDG